MRNSVGVTRAQTNGVLDDVSEELRGEERKRLGEGVVLEPNRKG